MLEYTSIKKGCFFMGYHNYLNSEELGLSEFSSLEERNRLFKKVIYWEICQGHLKSAKNHILNVSGISEDLCQYELGYLEEIEMNFNTSYKIFQDLLSKGYNPSLMLFRMASLKMQMGEYDEAEAILKERGNSEYGFKFLSSLIFLYFIKGDYYEALKVLSNIDVARLSPDNKIRYKEMNFFAKYFLGMIEEKYFDNIGASNGYSKKIIMEPDDRLLLEHVQKHFSGSSNQGFDNDLDLKQTLDYINGKIGNINCLYSSNASKYYIKTDTSVGEVYGERTNSIVVVENMGKIVTFYPVLLSDTFNKEGNLESKELKFKRIEGILKR